MTTSNWKITWDPAGTPLVLVDFGQKLLSEPVFSLAQGEEPVTLVDSAAPFLRPCGNAVVNITLETAADAASDALARAAIMRAIIATATSRKPLRVEASGYTTGYWQFAAAVVTSLAPQRHMETPAARHTAAWQITATGLTETTLP